MIIIIHIYLVRDLDNNLRLIFNRHLQETRSHFYLLPCFQNLFQCLRVDLQEYSLFLKHHHKVCHVLTFFLRFCLVLLYWNLILCSCRICLLFSSVWLAGCSSLLLSLRGLYEHIILQESWKVLIFRLKKELSGWSSPISCIFQLSGHPSSPFLPYPSQEEQ